MKHVCLFLVLIVLGKAQNQVPTTGLYFSVNGTVYLPGDTVIITDIGVFSEGTLEGAENSLVCHTEHVNTICCRGQDNPNGGRVPAEWLFPDGRIVPNHSSGADWTRSGFQHQLRLNRGTNTLTPTGDFNCTASQDSDSTVFVSESITLIVATVFVPSTLSVSEESPAVLVCATLAITPTAATTSRDVSVSLATSDGSASAGSDYTAVSIGLTFPAGSGDGAIRCLSIRITADRDTSEGEESFTVSLFTTDTVLLGTDRTNITITDADDVDECSTGVNNCDPHASCTNTVGSFTCACNQGYTGDGVTCLDIDECDTDLCDPNAVCTNIVGSFTCACSQGYSGDGTNCIMNLPSAPSNFQVASLNSTFIFLTWSQAPGEVADYYDIIYNFTIIGCSINVKNVLISGVNGSLRQLNLTQLHGNSDHIIKITARNGAGVSAPAQATATTSIAAPSAPPRNLHATDTTFTSITVEWEEVPCEHRNAEITHYVWRFINNDNPHNDGDSVRADVLGRNFTGLIPRNNYTIQVLAQHVDFSVFVFILHGPPATITAVTGVPPGLGFLLRGTPYSNNSAVALRRIGQRVQDSLYCLTDYTSCCREEEGGAAGEWFLPSGQTVPVGSVGTDFTSTRAPSAVLLNHLTTTGPSGVYTCQIPDTSGQLRTLYVGVDLTGALSILNLEYNRTSLTLTCSSHGRPVHSITWLKDNTVVGTEFSQGQTITDAVSATYQHTLRGDNRAALVGSFTCRVGDADGNTVSRTFKINDPVVSITASPVSSDFFTGLQLTLTCSVQVFYFMPDNVSVQWSKDGSPLVSDARLTVGDAIVTESPQLYESTVILNSLDGTRDSGEYTCTANINFTEIVVASSFTVTIPISNFQMQLSGLSDCQSWTLDNPIAKIRDLVDAIVENVASRCECNFTEDRITNSVFQCFSSTPQSVIYYAQLHGTLETNVIELISIIEDWVSTGVVIVVVLLPLTVFNICEVSSSTPLESCPRAVTTDAMSTITTDSAMNTSSYTPIIIIAVSILIAIAIVAVTVIIIAILYFRHNRSTVYLIKTKDRRLPRPPVELDSLGAEATDHQAHDYEDIENYNAVIPAEYEVPLQSKATGPVRRTTPHYESVKAKTECESTAGSDFNITKCLAYNIPVGSQGQP